jgi:hypothetical protein
MTAIDPKLQTVQNEFPSPAKGAKRCEKRKRIYRLSRAKILCIFTAAEQNPRRFRKNFRFPVSKLI